MCGNDGRFIELDIATHMQVNCFKLKFCAIQCVVTHDNKSLITAEFVAFGILTKWSIRSKKKLHTWQNDTDK